MATTINRANKATYTRIPLPVVGIHLNKTNPRMPQASVVTRRSSFRLFSRSITESLPILVLSRQLQM